MIEFTGMWIAPSMRPASHSYGSRQSTSWISSNRSYTPLTSLRSLMEAGMLPVGSIFPARRIACSNAAIERASNSTNRTSTTDVSASWTAATATGAASSTG